MPSPIDTHGSQSSSKPFGIFERRLGAGPIVISAEGELDLATSPRLKWMLLDALQAGSTELVIDLSLVSFMDSTALGVLVGVTKKLNADARLALVCVRPSVLKIFEFSGLDGSFAIFATVDEALMHVGRNAAWAR